MNKIKLDETISEILYIKHLEVIIDRLYYAKKLLTEREHRVIMNECKKRILKCESDWTKKKEEYNAIEIKVRREEKKTSRKNSKGKEHINKSTN